MRSQVRAYGNAAQPAQQTSQGLATVSALLLGQGDEPFADRWQHSVLPGWRLLIVLVAAGSGTARAFVRFVRDELTAL